MGKIKVGASRALINPPEELYPFPHFGKFSFEGQREDLYCRAIAIDNEETKFVILSVDCGDGPEMSLIEELTEHFGLEKDHIIGSNIHNHSAPQWQGRGMMGVDQQEAKEKGLAFRKIVVDAIYKVIGEALENMRPARYGFKEGDSYINVNRDFQLEDGNWVQSQNFRGFSDKTLAVIKFTDYEGELIAAFLNYGCHATTAFCVYDVDGKEKVTSGFPGICTKYIEDRYNNGAVCIWTSGCAGDQNPLFCSEGNLLSYESDGYAEVVPTPPGTQYMIQKHHGQTHAIDALKVLSNMACDSETMDIATASATVHIDTQKFPEGADRFLNWIMANNAYKQFRPDLLVDGRSPKREHPKMIPTGETVGEEIKLWQLGDIALIGAGELYSEIGWKMKQASPVKNVAIVTHCGFGGGYTLSDASKDHNVFQSFGKYLPGDIDGRYVAGVKELFEKIEK